MTVLLSLEYETATVACLTLQSMLHGDIQWENGSSPGTFGTTS